VKSVFAVVIGGYLGAAQWAMPLADRTLSFVPLIAQIQTMQANGQLVALFQANERVGGASVFYSQRLLKGLDTDAQLHEFLAASASNVAVMSGDTEPAAPLKVLKTMRVGRQAYYFVNL
jgi:hypothetical protein